jgi:phosphatidylinositol kinase/protein kinase (PI-3  family)
LCAGNFKSKFGVKRELSPFVFTPQFAAVFGGPNGDRYEEFCQVCCDAYNCLRKENQLIVSLFRLMISSGLPEVSDGWGGGAVKVVGRERRADQVGCFVVVLCFFFVAANGSRFDMVA